MAKLPPVLGRAWAATAIAGLLLLLTWGQAGFEAAAPRGDSAAWNERSAALGAATIASAAFVGAAVAISGAAIVARSRVRLASLASAGALGGAAAGIAFALARVEVALADCQLVAACSTASHPAAPPAWGGGC